MQAPLPPIPAKRYFTIGEVSELCGVKPYVLRYWEQEFAQLRPMKRRGNRRYYQHHEVLLVRRIRELLYEQGFTINGARGRLAESSGRRGAWSATSAEEAPALSPQDDLGDLEQGIDKLLPGDAGALQLELPVDAAPSSSAAQGGPASGIAAPLSAASLRRELLLIRDLLSD